MTPPRAKKRPRAGGRDDGGGGRGGGGGGGGGEGAKRAALRDGRFDMAQWAESDRSAALPTSIRDEGSDAAKDEGVPSDDESLDGQASADDGRGEFGEAMDASLPAGVEAEGSEGQVRKDDGQEDASEEEEGDDGDDDQADQADHKVVKPLTPEELERFERRQRRRGLVYLSHIPRGMTVPKVRHLLSCMGEVERIYLHDARRSSPSSQGGASKTTTTRPNAPLSNRERKRAARFTEGWVEFKDKRVAKATAALLNAQPVGAALGGFGVGRRGGGRGGGGGSSGSSAQAKAATRRWRDEVWTMKYLPGYRWAMLSEQLANERASHASRLRAELSQSAYEQKDYLRKVERARVQRDREERRQRRTKGEAGGEEAREGDGQGAAGGAGEGRADATRATARSFRQRSALYRDVRDVPHGVAASAEGAGEATTRRRDQGEGAKTGRRREESRARKRRRGRDEGGGHDDDGDDGDGAERKLRDEALRSALTKIF